MLKDDLKRLRKRAKLTQKELAEKSGISFSYLTKLESGVQTNPTFEILEALSAALNAPLGVYKRVDEKLVLEISPKGKDVWTFQDQLAPDIREMFLATLENIRGGYNLLSLDEYRHLADKLIECVSVIAKTLYDHCDAASVTFEGLDSEEPSAAQSELEIKYQAVTDADMLKENISSFLNFLVESRITFLKELAEADAPWNDPKFNDEIVDIDISDDII